MKKMKVKFREVKDYVRKIVLKYRKGTKDRRKFPEFSIGCLADDATRGYVQLAFNDALSDPVAYNSLPELGLILESFGKAWQASNP